MNFKACLLYEHTHLNSVDGLVKALRLASGVPASQH